jgi:hypothetical protein
MDETDLRLDGNAAAGMLSEVFSAEMTNAVLTCAGCGQSGALGAAHAYADGPGLVLRCPACNTMLMRFARLRDRIVGDMRGVSSVMTAQASSP